ncbi:VWA domain-containing protein [Spongiibacter sp. KMU-158]|uniref:VWA domain-containing protein n=1 Tax=Spongiibacter pelagi TaxID=2760804 RepID=A0A927C100_9GAMM|nr:VWA domain-containing protein [Spongiibacter pelagi]MBD2858037.1 VWA domain-containing protein [Spongiibacter pelagi]
MLEWSNLPWHWLRPELWWTALPLCALLLLLSRQQISRSHWHKVISPELLPWLLDKDSGKPSPTAMLIPSLACLLVWLALLGPAWHQLPGKLQRNADALVIVLDLSPSMFAEDIKPSRLQQAKYKIRDLLDLREDGQTGLIASAGDAFVVAPLTDDSNTLNHQLQGLNPDMMPVPGSNLLAGLQQAQTLLEQGGASQGRILFIGDGFADSQWPTLKRFAQTSAYSISVLAIGTSEGAPIPLAKGGFLKDSQGNIIVPRLDNEAFAKLATSSGGLYRQLSLDNSDILPLSQSTALGDEQTDSQRQLEQWQDGAPWLILLTLPLCLLGFRRQFIPLVLLIPFTLSSHHAEAQTSAGLNWENLWQTPDQQGAKLFNSDPAQAAQHFQDPAWRGAAHYRAGEFNKAAQDFAKDPSANGHYNLGNALAKQGKFDEAKAAYKEALKLDPELTDAQSNLEKIEQLEQQQQNSQDSQDPNSKDGDKADTKDQQGPENQQGQQNQQEQGQQNNSESDSAQDGEQQESQDSASENASNNDQNPEQQANQQQADDYARQQATESEHSANPATPSREETSEDGTSQDQALGMSERAQTLDEEQQAQEQFLRRIPENDDAFLRRKFHYQAEQRSRQGELPQAEDIAPY